ncbi:MAG: alanine racemase, partial [Verrucomicrobia bacterium]|nr:alanine racemase [Verrucomicrobiota bacterium]
MAAKKHYEKPLIERQVAGLINKFGRRGLVRPMDEIDGVSVASLVQRHGSPLFVLSEKTLRQKYRQARQAFSLQYPRVQFAWSYKTNHLNAVCAVFHQEGAWAEVVSEAEYERARGLGVPGPQIIYNGPYKSQQSLKQAAEEGAFLHIDHLDEMFQLEKIAADLGRKLPVAIRVNLDAGIYPVWSRFGFNLENGEAAHAVRRLTSGRRLTLRGLHTHLGTFILDADAYRRAALKLADFALSIEKDFGARVQYLDLGGGFASANTLLEQYLPGEHASPTFEQYATAISGALLDSPLVRGQPPLLLLETGRALVDEAGCLITTVVGKRTLADGRRGLIIDAGVNLAFTAFWYKLDVIPAQAFDHFLEDTVIYGPLCMNIDVVRDNIRLPDLHPGDRLVL